MVRPKEREGAGEQCQDRKDTMPIELAFDAEVLLRSYVLRLVRC